ncbi:MAG: type II toxin-antitoxin system VapC family toxin [Candidatus Nanopelagicales bacterium]
MAVLDASAILALIHDEPGADLVAERLASGLLSTVNLAEVVTKLAFYDSVRSDLVADLLAAGVQIREFDAAQALRAGELIRVTRRAGLSLGDRSCLALALSAQDDPDVVTADRLWPGLGLPVRITLIR